MSIPSPWRGPLFAEKRAILVHFTMRNVLFFMSCGESYFTAQTMHELERIKALRKSVAKPRNVSVAMFTPAEA